MLYDNKKKRYGVIMVLIIILIALVPFLLGMNPYNVVKSVCTRLYWQSIYARNGLSVTQNGTYFGLRDHDSTILDTKYTQFENLDKKGNYIAAKQIGERDSESEIWVIYNLDKRKFVFENTYSFCIAEIKTIDDKQFKLINSDGRHFATLRLPGFYGEEYCDEITIVPHFSEASTPVETFIQSGSAEPTPPEDEYWKEMYTSNPIAYTLLFRVSNMAGEECSPANDLNFAKAVEYYVDKDAHYKGNLDKALGEIGSIVEILGAGNTGTMTACAEYGRLLSNLRMSVCYSDIIGEYPLYKEEYIAWHNLIEAIAYYSDYICENGDWYQCKAMDDEFEKASWFSTRLSQLEKERKIMAGMVSYTASSDSLKTLTDVLRISEKYYSPKAPEYYHPMWYEIRPAVEAWLEVRDKIADSLSADRAKSYREQTKEVTDWIYGLIKSKDDFYFVPALPR